MLFRILPLLLVVFVSATEFRYDCAGFVEKGLSRDPMLAETRFSTQAKKDKISAIKASAVLSKFEASMLVGPAPGLKETVDVWGDTVDTWDFTKMGPFFGTEIKAVQPLNYGQYVVGKKAAEADLRQQEMNVVGEEHSKSVELQTYYYNYLLALEMIRLASDAEKQLNNASDKIEDALDNDDQKVSQMDLLELKAGRHSVDEGVIDAKNGLLRVKLAIQFVLNLDSSDSFLPLDTVLAERDEYFPSLEEAKQTAIVHHPDLKRLSAGLSARQYQVELAEAKLGPQFFLMGEFTYVKSWAGNRQAIQKDAFAQDAVNKISGTVGFGMKYNLNFWNSWEAYSSARTELRSLKLKNQYAQNGTLLKLEDQYVQVTGMKDKLESLRSSLRASEAILKGAAIQYDLDPSSNTKSLVSAYKQNLELKKDYYYAVCKYNIAFAELINKMGLSLSEYHQIFPRK
ncbi:MAG: TolC family protein [Fibrobacteraceae bacterium]|nr:TolC family protein [Fibrobacteraceae bacterium]